MASPQKLKIKITVLSSNSTSGHIPKRIESRVLKRYYTLMFITAALFAIAKRRKEYKYPLVEEWINKMWYKHTMEYYSDLIRKDILAHATK